MTPRRRKYAHREDDADPDGEAVARMSASAAASASRRGSRHRRSAAVRSGARDTHITDDHDVLVPEIARATDRPPGARSVRDPRARTTPQEADVQLGVRQAVHAVHQAAVRSHRTAARRPRGPSLGRERLGQLDVGAQVGTPDGTESSREATALRSRARVHGAVAAVNGVAGNAVGSMAPYLGPARDRSHPRSCLWTSSLEPEPGGPTTSPEGQLTKPGGPTQRAVR